MLWTRTLNTTQNTSHLTIINLLNSQKAPKQNEKDLVEPRKHALNAVTCTIALRNEKNERMR